MNESIKPLTHTNHPALYYEDMLADNLRMERYRAAISQLVTPGDVVADLGTGMGVLAMMASQAGAERVYAIDNRENVIKLAQQMVAANKLTERIILICADARELEVDEPVDLVLNELIGDFGTDENIFECVRAFSNRNLKRDGKVLPATLKTFLQPVQYRDEFRGIWRDGYHGLDLRPGLELPTTSEPVMRILAREPIALAQEQILEDIEFGRDMPERCHDYSVEFTVLTGGMLQGFMGYFESTLVPGIELQNHPTYPGCHWQTWHWPIYPPQPVSPGQQITACVHARPNMIASGWSMDWAI